MEYLFIILFIYASYLKALKSMCIQAAFSHGEAERTRRNVGLHLPPSIRQLLRLVAGIIGKSRYQMRHSLTIDDNSGQPESA